MPLKHVVIWHVLVTLQDTSQQSKLTNNSLRSTRIVFIRCCSCCRSGRHSGVGRGESWCSPRPGHDWSWRSLFLMRHLVVVIVVLPAVNAQGLGEAQTEEYSYHCGTGKRHSHHKLGLCKVQWSNLEKDRVSN